MTEKFPKDQCLLEARGPSGVPLCLFLHDPHHPTIKGRVWTFYPAQKIRWETELASRLKEALQKRLQSNIPRERENYYLCFGEADRLPGLFILKHQNHILVQFFAFYWEKFLGPHLWENLRPLLQSLFPEETLHLWTQDRQNRSPFIYKETLEKGQPVPLIQKISPSVVVKEFGLSYELELDRYDIGLYTDMGQIRRDLQVLLRKRKSPAPGKTLNLFCFTGAFSLLFLKENFSVVSVDISPNNLEWLEKNLTLNGDLPASRHQSLLLSTELAVKKLIREKQTFDWIICDPPPVISLGAKKMGSVDFYQKLLPQLLSLLSPQGHLLTFLNTHKISLGKFQKKMEKAVELEGKGPALRLVRTFSLGGDCPRQSQFPEGDYLKGLLWTS